MIELMFLNNFVLPIFMINEFGLYTSHRITPEESYRPDLIAENTLGDVRFTIPILKLNSLTATDLVSGLIIKIPVSSIVGTTYS